MSNRRVEIIRPPHLAGGTSTTTDSAERPPSARAQQAIDREGTNE